MVKNSIIQLTNFILSAILCFFAVIMISPLFIIFFLSIDNGYQHYFNLFSLNSSYLQGLINSIIISFVSSSVSVCVSFFAAFFLAKNKHKWVNILFFIYILVFLMPFQVTMLPQYIVSKTLKIYDSLLAMICPGIFAPFTTILLTQIIKTIPDDAIEAARLETSSRFVILSKIVAPYVKPGLICAWILNFTEQWNAVSEPLVLLEQRNNLPLSVLLSFAPPLDPDALAATVIFAIIPLLFFLRFGKYVLSGLEGYKLK
ncbi:MAG: ABC transporter permease subunit [Eubacteriales bacterium]